MSLTGGLLEEKENISPCLVLPRLGPGRVGLPCWTLGGCRLFNCRRGETRIRTAGLDSLRLGAGLQESKNYATTGACPLINLVEMV